MIRVGYTAQRELVGYHQAGDIVSLTFSTQVLNPGRRVSRSQQVSMSGAKETFRYFSAATWQLTTEPLQGASLDAMIEFLSSVEGGEPFTFEAWLNQDGPSLDADFLTGRFRALEATNVTLTSEGWTLEEVIRTGTGGDEDWVAISFSVEQVPP